MRKMTPKPTIISYSSTLCPIHFAGTMLTIFPDRGLFCVVVIAPAGGLGGGTALGAGAAEGALSRCLAASIFSPCSIR